MAWIVLAVAAIARPGMAHEPVTAMVEALCARGYYDTAVDYLEGLKTASYVGDDVRKAVPFQQGTVLMRQAQATNDASVRARLYQEAGERLKQFLAASPNSESAPSATGRLAQMEVERARSLTAAALAAGKSVRPAKLAEARKVFEQAGEQLATAEKALTAAIDAMPKLLAPEEHEKRARKQELSTDLAEAQFTSASINYELAMTHEAGSEDAKQLLTSAAERFGQLFEAYRTRGTGLFARLWEGKCYQALGDRRRALSAYQDLLELSPKAAEVRVVRTKAVRQALELWCSPEERKYEAAVRLGEEWVEQNSRLMEADPDGLAVRYYLAVAYQRQMTAAKRNSPTRRPLQLSALKHARAAARHPSEFRTEATKMVAALGGDKEADPDAPPANFAEAFERGKRALDRLQGAKMSQEIAVQTEDDEALQEAKKEEAAAKAEAAQYFRLALQVDPGEAKSAQFNPVRYYVCYFNYDEGRYWEAAVMGDYLARRFAQSAEGRQGARIALASWVKLYTDGGASEKAFLSDKVMATASYIAKTWPDQDEAVEATSTLLNFAIQQRDTSKVLEYLEQIPLDSPRRAESELRAGQALWANYLKDARLPESERPPAAELDRTKTQAAEILQKGVEHMRDAQQVTPTLIASVVALAQVLVDLGQPEKAVEWLENDTVGPLTLLADEHEGVLNNPQMPIEIYKVALRAYVAVEPQRLDDAFKIIESLKKAVHQGGDLRADENLTMIFIALGRELQQQLEELRASNNQKQLTAVSLGFEKILSEIASQQKGNTWSSLTWVAETFYSLGSGFDEGSGPASKEARRFYEQAVPAYEAILTRATSDPKFAPSAEAMLGVRLRMASCLTKIGEYDKAIAEIAQVLKERPMMLPAQIQGAETYQAKGLVDKDAYAYAILGGTEKGSNGQPVIWGWARISKLTMNNEKFTDEFHRSRRQLAECRYLFGMLNKDKAKRQRTIEAARQDMWMTYKLYPNLGGDQHIQEYERLLKKIQKALGDKPLGLEEFRRRSAEATKAANEAGK